MEPIHFTEYNPNDFEEWLNMGLLLWKDENKEELRAEFINIIKTNSQKPFFAKNGAGKPIGFINVSIRVDYVEGADGAPTGFIEGIFVKASYQKKGIAQQLVKVAEKWLLINNCHQIGSSTWLWNKGAQAFHEKIGFRKEVTLVHFIKEI